MCDLAILIPTIAGREPSFKELNNTLNIQSKNLIAHKGRVEIVFYKDNKEISIGAKRQLLLNRANAKYCVFIDDDDSVPKDYIQTVIDALQQNPDCIGYIERIDFNGKRRFACHSNKYDDWANNVDGYDYVRTIFCKDVIRTDIVRQIGFKDIRFGEDYDFANRLKASGLLKNEVFINKEMYFYSTKSVKTKKAHNERYGIKS